jgi:hypothetical protein
MGRCLEMLNTCSGYRGTNYVSGVQFVIRSINGFITGPHSVSMIATLLYVCPKCEPTKTALSIHI